MKIKTKDSNGVDKEYLFGGDANDKSSIVTLKEFEEKTKNLKLSSPVVDKLIRKNNGKVYVE